MRGLHITLYDKLYYRNISALDASMVCMDNFVYVLYRFLYQVYSMYATEILKLGLTIAAFAMLMASADI